MLAGSDCLSKKHLATGVVLFKDVCTKEWAINSASIAGQRAGGKCLTKVTHPDGVVLFRDVCTDEWAMNTTEFSRQRIAPPG
jgi:phenylpyruvate tautomerase PptA (4-oxalocrotonate tautomerase family)